MITRTLTRVTNTRLSAGFQSLAIRLATITLTVAGLAFTTFSTADVANAQYQNQNQRVRAYSQQDVERLIRNVEQSSKEFQRDFDSWLDRSRLDGQRREDQYNRRVSELTRSLSSLRSNFNGRNDWWSARTDMQRVLNAATQVNTAFSNRDGRGMERQWNRLRRSINLLSEAFNLPAVGSNWTASDSRFPEGRDVRNCATGVYRGMTNNGETELSIMENGMATARSLVTSTTYSGRCANDTLYFDWGAFRLVRDNRGVSTVEIGNEGNRTSYRRVSGYGDNVQTYPTQGYPNQYPNQNYPNQNYPNQNYPNQNYPGLAGDVPNWAVGTFRGTTDSGESELTIGPNGQAAARSLTTGQVFNGGYANGILTFDWGSFRVERDGRGIRTVDANNQRNRTSYRRVN